MEGAPTYTGQHLCTAASGLESIRVEGKEGDRKPGVLVLHPPVSVRTQEPAVPYGVEAALTTVRQKKCCRLWPLPKTALKPPLQGTQTRQACWVVKGTRL